MFIYIVTVNVCDFTTDKSFKMRRMLERGYEYLQGKISFSYFVISHVNGCRCPWNETGNFDDVIISFLF